MAIAIIAKSKRVGVRGLIVLVSKLCGIDVQLLGNQIITRAKKGKTTILKRVEKARQIVKRRPSHESPFRL